MSAEGPQITQQRHLTLSRANSSVEWHVNEFDGGERFMLVASAANGGVHLSAYFAREQWAEFQAMVAGGQS